MTNREGRREPSFSRTVLVVVPLILLGQGCASRILNAENSTEILKNTEFENKISVRELPPTEQFSQSGTYVRLPGPEPVAVSTTSPGAAGPVSDASPITHSNLSPSPSSPSSRGRRTLGRNAAKPLVGKKIVTAKGKGASGGLSEGVVVVPPSIVAEAPAPREPSIEDTEGFVGRRPKVDPYRTGEKVTMEASYFGVVAGDITFEVRPFVEVNGRRSYTFAGTARSTSVFAMFYAVEDWFETWVDYETMVPYSYALHVKESKQLRESRSIFDWKTMMASFWDKRIDAETKVEEKNYEWSIPSYAQNVFTAPFYLRSFRLVPGKKLAVRVAHEKENLLMTVEVLRRERISTPAGDFNTVVVKPKIELNGVFKPVGDIFVWFTDDDRKFIVRVESKIRIGKIVAVAKKVEPGRP